MSEANPIVSVILPTYNRAHTLRRAIKSVLNQDYYAIELIVVDDASTDDTTTLLESITDQRLRIIRHERNKGVAGATNTGIYAAQGAIIAFQDSDDEWLFGKLEKQVKAFTESSDNTVLVYCTKIFYGRDSNKLSGPRRVTCVPGAKNTKLSGNLRQELQFESNISTQSMLVSREALLRINGFDTRLRNSQDWDLVSRLSELGNFVHIDEPLVNTYWQDDSISRIKENSVYSLLIIYNKMKRRGLSVKSQAKRYARLGYSMGRLGYPARGNKLLKTAFANKPLSLGILARLILNLLQFQKRRRVMKGKWIK